MSARVRRRKRRGASSAGPAGSGYFGLNCQVKAFGFLEAHIASSPARKEGMMAHRPAGVGPAEFIFPLPVLAAGRDEREQAAGSLILVQCEPR